MIQILPQQEAHFKQESMKFAALRSRTGDDSCPSEIETCQANCDCGGAA
jgi:hypothetical protein